MSTQQRHRPAEGLPTIHFLGGPRETLRHVCRVLRYQGHRTRIFADAAGLQATLRHSRRDDDPQFVVVDQAAFEEAGPSFALPGDAGSGAGTTVPFVVASDRDDLVPRLAAYRAGAVGYLLKPIDPTLLSALAASAFSKHKSAPAYRVLLVDDMPSVLKLHAAYLESAGMEVRTLTEPLRLLRMLDDFQPDVLVLDVLMQDAEGPELTAVLRQREQNRNLPILFLSSDSDPDRQLRALELGGDDFLMKPVEPAHLVAAVAARARRARQESDVAARLRSVQYERDREHLALERHAHVSVTDRSGTIIHVNDKFCEVSGYSRAELIGQNHRMVKSEHHPQEFYRDLWRTIRSGEIWTGEICNYRKDGSPFWTESTIVPFFDEDDCPYQYVSIRTEITRVKQAEERIRISQNYANIGTWDWNVRTGELLWSERVGPLFGFSEPIAETTWQAFLNCVHPDDRTQIEAAVDDCFANGAKYRVEYRCVWTDGTIRWLLGTGDVVRNGRGQPINMLGVVQDITGLKQAQEALVNAKEEAEEANRAKSDFLSAMSHELRTPLNAILGFAQVLEIDGDLNDDQRDSVQTIRKSGKHLLQLINEVLDLARIESGRIDLSIEEVGLDDVFGACGKLVAPIAGERQISVVFNRAVGAEAVRADRTRLRQVLLNLLSNGVKYGRKGSQVTVTALRSGRERVRISVQNAGEGIAEDKLRQLYTAFDRLGAEHTNVEGAGIGLVISKRLTEAMGGGIEAQSIAGSGATFSIELPIATPRTEAEPPIGPGRLGGPLPAGTVLYVEDNPANLKLVRQALIRHPQITLLEADNGPAGLELAGSRRPDVILLDINMAVMDGLDVLARLRADPRTCAIPAVAISAAAMKPDVDRALAAGFRRYLTKPIDLVELLDVIAELLREPDRRRGDRRATSCRGPGQPAQYLRPRNEP